MGKLDHWVGHLKNFHFLGHHPVTVKEGAMGKAIDVQDGKALVRWDDRVHYDGQEGDKVPEDKLRQLVVLIDIDKLIDMGESWERLEHKYHLDSPSISTTDEQEDGSALLSRCTPLLRDE